jgi:hypothetical protein
VGCGTGFFVKWYLSKGCKVTGIDITEISVKRLRKVLPGEYHTRDITAVDYPRGETNFEIINIWDVIYHVVDNDAYDRALDNITGDLGIDGLLLLTDFLGDAANTNRAPHVLGRCLATYKEKLPDRGFQLVELRPLYKFLNTSHFGYLDNYLGSLYYFADNLFRNISPGNLSLSVWRKVL